jgi:hypothetical protein
VKVAEIIVRKLDSYIVSGDKYAQIAQDSLRSMTVSTRGMTTDPWWIESTRTRRP